MSNVSKTPLQNERSFTIRNAPYTYLHLSLVHVPESTTNRPVLDAVTARTYLTAALSQYLGLTGSAIPIDMLKVTERDVWVRVAREDASMVVAALAQWANGAAGVAFKIEGRGEWLGGVVAGSSSSSSSSSQWEA